VVHGAFYAGEEKSSIERFVRLYTFFHLVGWKGKCRVTPGGFLHVSTETPLCKSRVLVEPLIHPDKDQDIPGGIRTRITALSTIFC